MLWVLLWPSHYRMEPLTKGLVLLLCYVVIGACFLVQRTPFTSTYAASSDDLLTLQAKKLVINLNLFPDINLNIAANSSSSEPRGKLIEDLGHYAGYYPFQQYTPMLQVS